MNGIERLEEQTLKINNPNVTGIFNYLKTRKDLEKYFENEEKSMDKMYEYVTEKAKEKAYKMVAMIEDNLVYLWATNYFMKSNEELKIAKNEEKPKVQTEIVKQKEIKKEEKKENKDEQITLFQEVQK